MQAAIAAKEDERSAIPVAAAAMKVRGLEQSMDDARRELSERQVCPHCGEGVAVRRNKVEMADLLATIERRISEADAQLADAVNEHADLQDKTAPLHQGN